MTVNSFSCFFQKFLASLRHEMLFDRYTPDSQVQTLILVRTVSYLAATVDWQLPDADTPPDFCSIRDAFSEIYLRKYPINSE